MGEKFDSTHEERLQRFNYYLEKLGEENERLEVEIQAKRAKRKARESQSSTSKKIFDFKLFPAKKSAADMQSYKVEIEEKLNNALESYGAMRDEMAKICQDLAQFKAERDKFNDEIQNF